MAAKKGAPEEAPLLMQNRGVWSLCYNVLVSTEDIWSSLDHPR